MSEHDLDLVARLRSRADSYRQSGPSAEHTAALLDEAASSIEQVAEDAFNEGWRSREARPGRLVNSRAEMRREWLGCNVRDALGLSGD